MQAITMKFLFMVHMPLLKLLVTNACTEFRLTSEDNSVIVGRSMEFDIDLESHLIVEPKKFSHTATPELKCIPHSRLQWQNKYSIAYLDLLDMPVAADGLNEAGLSVAGNMFPGFSHFQKIPIEKCNMAVSSIQFPLWILGNFGTVQELRDALKKDSFPLVWQDNVPMIKIAFELHYSIIDASGDSIVIEYTKQGRKVYNNTLGIFTNSPPYDFQLINIRNYIQMSKFAHDPLVLGKMKFEATGQGSGLLGIPGDLTPPSRFVRTAAMVHFADQVKTGSEAVMLAFHILNTVDIPWGVSTSFSGIAHEYTLWAVAKDLKTKSLYFRDYNNLTIRVLRMAEVKKAEKLKMKVGGSIGGFVDITNDLKPAMERDEL